MPHQLNAANPHTLNMVFNQIGMRNMPPILKPQPMDKMPKASGSSKARRLTKAEIRAMLAEVSSSDEE